MTGTNITSAAKEGGVHDEDTAGENENPNYDWDSIESSMKGKTSWSFHPPGCQFRNGAVEIFVKKFKRTLKHKFSKRLMFMLELQTSFKIVASILNSRPIYARWGNRGLGDTDFLSPLTPNMLLTGRVNTEVPVREYDTSTKPLYRMKYVEECVAQWWNQFMTQNFSSLVPRQKWQFERRNMRVGDVVLINYAGKCRPATYRLGMIVSVVVDPDKLVRTVTVEYSILSELPVAKRLLYKGVTKKRITVAVQRLCLILPVEEREENFSSGGQAGRDSLSEVSDQHGLDHEVGDYIQHVPVDGDGGNIVTNCGWEVGNKGGGEADHGVNEKAGQVGGLVQERPADAKDFIKKSMKTWQSLDCRFQCEDFERYIYRVFHDELDFAQ